MRRLIAILLCSLTVANCAVHPLPENVTGNVTELIVKKILCESRDALDRITIDLLRRSGDTRYAHRYADEIERGSLKATDIVDHPESHPLVLEPELRAVFEYYTLSAVTFDFQLISSEINDNGFQTDLRLPFVSSLFTLGGMADAKLQRQNVQKFQLTNSFDEIHRISRQTCDELGFRSRNIVYPIVGTIGVEGIFRRFVDLDSGERTTGTANSVHQFTEQLQFTTTLVASVMPKLAINPVAVQSLRFADAFGTLSATRMDMHQVTISIAKGPKLGTLQARRDLAKATTLAIANANRVQNFFLGIQQTNTLLGLPPIQ